MKILDTTRIRALDAYTIRHEPIASVDLMERAALAFTGWFAARFDTAKPVKVFCGLGNNGGDGLAIARLLMAKEYAVSAYVVDYSDQKSDDWTVNYGRVSRLLTVQHIATINNFPLIGDGEVFIDAVFGSGLSRPAEGLVKDVIDLMNEQASAIVSVDIASGLYADGPTPEGSTIVKPQFTVAFQVPKLAFLLPRNAPFVGEWQVVDIGLNQAFLGQSATRYEYLDKELADSLLRPRTRYSHKGTFGHALLIGGSYGKMGAAVLSARACLRSGVGLLTTCIPQCGYEIMQTAVPEAMALTDDAYGHFSFVPPLQPYDAIGIGPGLGKAQETLKAFGDLLMALEQHASLPHEEEAGFVQSGPIQSGPVQSGGGFKGGLVVDADALNLLSENRELLRRLPPDTILTPHPKEFERLAGEAGNDFERLELLKEFAATHRIYIVLKGAHTAVATPDGTVYFNSTGNPGMATGGTGDALTGMIAALLAQSYPPLEAALIGVYQHGRAGDRAAAQRGQSALIASDLIEAIGW